MISDAGYLSRRSFLRVTSGTLAILSGGIGAASMDVGIRKNAKNLTDAEWATFERGVAAMKQIPKSSAVSWWFQANIHGCPPDEPAPIFQGWKTCQHGNWWFLPWHRAYLLYFEKIVRAYCGDPGFMIPYWDWTDPTQQSLPARFLKSDSPLYEENRNANINGGGPIDPHAVSWPSVAKQTIFSTPITGQGIGSEREESPGVSGSHGAMESLCHDLVHDSIGGLMGDPDTAARDPIFWLHHANVDRLWSTWLRARGGAYLPNETLWLNTPFLFYGAQGHGGYVMAGQMLNSESLGYRYQDYPSMSAMAVATSPAPPYQDRQHRQVIAAASQEKKTTIATMDPPATELTSEPLSVTFKPDADGKRRVESVARPAAQAPALGGVNTEIVQGPSLQVVIDDIQFTKSPGRFYEVYVNLPAPEDASGPESLYFAGSISFFALSANHGEGHAMAAGPARKTATVDITEAVSRLRAAGKLGDEIKVTLVERSAKPKSGVVSAPTTQPVPKVTIGKIRLQHSGN